MTCLLPRRLAVLLLALLFALAAPLTLSAADDDGDKNDSSSSSSSSNRGPYVSSNEHALVLMDAGAQSPKAAPGKVVEVVLPIAVNREYLPTERYVLRNITIEPDIPAEKASVEQWPFDLINASYVRHLEDMSFNSTATVYYEFRVSHLAKKGVYPLNFTVTATVWRDDDFNGTTIREDVEFALGVYITVTDDGGESGVVSGIGPITVAGATDGRGVMDTPVGRPGGTITMYIPIINKGGKLTDITVAPVVSASVEEFPFVADQINMGRNLADMKKGAEVTLDYTFTVSPRATTGNKPVQFRATYRENGVYGECTFLSHIYIEDGYEELLNSAPVVTVTGYSLSVGGKEVRHLNAGDEALLKLDIQNNSTVEPIYKATATITISNPEAFALASGSSDTEYTGQIAPGAQVELEYRIQARASAPVGPSAIGIDLKYENGEVIQGVGKQSIMLAVKQPMKVVVDEPIVYSDQKAGEPIAVNLNIVNMGRTKLYNVNIVAMGGIGMYESYYGGDLAPAGTLSADVQVVSSAPGAVDGKLLVCYEDSDGEAFTEELSLSLQVEAPAAPPMPPEEQEEKPTGGGGLPFLGLTVLGGSGGAWYLKLRRGKNL